MFKGFQDTSRGVSQFKGFPNLNFQMNREAYGFTGLRWQFDPRYYISSRVNGALISYWADTVYGRRFIQSTGSRQPTYVSSDVLYNGYPTLNFSDDARNLVSQQGFLEWGFDTTIYAVANVTQINTINTLLHRPTVSFVRLNFAGNIVTSPTINGIGMHNVTTPMIASTIEDTLPHIVVLTPTKLIIDGVHVASGVITSATVVANIGGESTIGFIGHVAEIGAFAGDFTVEQAMKLSNMLNKKFAIY